MVPAPVENETMRIVNSFRGVSLDRFEDRLRLQKLGYLAQELGASGGFMFSWYHRGPYSPTLTRELFRYESMGRLGEDSGLTRREMEVVAKMKGLLGRGIDSARALELYASLWYLLPRRGASAKDSSVAVEDLLKQKPRFTRKEADRAASAILGFRRKLQR